METPEFNLEAQQRIERARRARKGQTFVFDLRRNNKGGGEEVVYMGEIAASSYEQALKGIITRYRASLRRLEVTGWRIVERGSQRESVVVPGQM